MNIAALAMLSLVFAWTALRGAGVQLGDWNISVLALALLAAFLCRGSRVPRLDRSLAWPLILVPAWVLLQIVPLPVDLVRLFSPARAALAAATGQSGAIPLSAYPALTFAEWMRLAGCLLAFLIARELGWRFSEKRTPWAVVMPLVVVACLEAVLGVIQFYSGATTEGAHGTYISRDHYAGLMEMALPFPIMYGMAALWRGRSRFESPLRPALVACAAFAAAALILLGSILSLSRMGFFAALFSIAVVGTCMVRKKRWLLAAPLAIVLLVVYLPPDELIARFADISSTDKLSAQDRLEVWRETLPLAAAYPLTGCGLGAFESAFIPFKRSTPLLTDNFAHNDYLQYLAELGIPAFLLGLVFLTGILARAARTASRHASPAGRALALACLASLSALLLHSWVDFNSYIPGNAFAFAWIAGLSVSVIFSSRTPASPPSLILEVRPGRSFWS